MSGPEVFAVVVGIIAAVLAGGALAGPTGSLLGFLITTIPVLLVLTSRSQRKKEDPGARAAAPESSGGQPAGDRLDCPRCGESIAASARVCRFCNHELPPVD